MLVEIVEVLGIDKAEATLYFRVKALAELVKYVEAPFMRVLHDYTRLFQKEIADLPSDRLACREADLDVLALKESFHKCQLMKACCTRSLTNLDELLFLTVLALPNASKSGLDCMMTSLVCCAL